MSRSIDCLAILYHPSWILLMTLFCSPLHAKRYALLVGINDYPNAPKLQGARNDVLALQSALTDWGFQPSNIQAILDEKATKANILAALKQMVTGSKKGDHLFFFFSGHGTSHADKRMYKIALPYGSGAFMPVDFNIDKPKLAHLIVGRTDINPILTQLPGDRQMFIFYDSCFSGAAVRGQSPQHKKGVDMMLDDVLSFNGINRFQESEPADYPYPNVLFIAASAEDQWALDIIPDDLAIHPTLDGKAHGLMTDALLRILANPAAMDKNHDQQLNYYELFQGLGEISQNSRLNTSQTPAILPKIQQDPQRLANQPLFAFRQFRHQVKIPAEHSLRVYVPKHLSTLRKKIQAVKAIQLSPRLQARIEIKATGQRIELLDAKQQMWARIEYPSAEQVLNHLNTVLWMEDLTRQAVAFQLVLQFTGQRQSSVFEPGQYVSFAMLSDEPAYLLLLNVNAAGEVRRLYPIRPSQQRKIQSGEIVFAPNEKAKGSIKVFDVGKDYVLLLAYRQRPDVLYRLTEAIIYPNQKSMRSFKQGVKKADAVTFLSALIVPKYDW